MLTVGRSCSRWRALARLMRGLRHIGAMGAVLWPSADSAIVQPGHGRGISSHDASGSVVELLRGTQAEHASHACWGAIIACHKSYGIVLTAAHCVLPLAENSATSLYVRFGTALFSPSRVSVHPRFRLENRSSNFDIATVETPPCSGTQRAVPLSSDPHRTRVGDPVMVQAPSSPLQPPAWTAVPVAAVTATSLTLVDTAPVCIGSSGGPVLEGDSGGHALVGVISSGPSNCIHGVKVARVATAFRGFLDNTMEGRPPVLVPRLCGECIEQAWEGSAHCVTSIHACRQDTHCTQGLACMADERRKRCSRSLREMGASHELLVRAQRCVCLVECSAECADLCSE